MTVLVGVTEKFGVTSGGACANAAFGRRSRPSNAATQIDFIVVPFVFGARTGADSISEVPRACRHGAPGRAVRSARLVVTVNRDCRGKDDLVNELCPEPREELPGSLARRGDRQACRVVGCVAHPSDGFELIEDI